MTPEREQVLEALRGVVDPELGVDVVELGLIYDVSVEREPDGAAVHVLFSLTSPGCPAAGEIAEAMESAVMALPHVGAVFPRLTFDPRWTPERMSPDARFALGR